MSQSQSQREQKAREERQTMAWPGLYRDATAFPDTLPLYFRPWLGRRRSLASETPAKNSTPENLRKSCMPELPAVTSLLDGGRHSQPSLELTLICRRALA